MQKLSVNLYQAELLPDKPLWTLNRVVALWISVLIIMIAWTVLSTQQQNKLSAQASLLNIESNQYKDRLAGLEAQVKKNQADTKLLQELKTFKTLLANKNNLHQQLTDPKTTYAVGFSMAMTELSQYHHRDISLQKIKMNNANVSFTGVAKSPAAIPLWLAGFEQSTFLSGKSFVHFSLSENEQMQTEFVVSSDADVLVAGQ